MGCVWVVHPFSWFSKSLCDLSVEDAKCIMAGLVEELWTGATLEPRKCDSWLGCSWHNCVACGDVGRMLSCY